MPCRACQDLLRKDLVVVAAGFDALNPFVDAFERRAITDRHDRSGAASVLMVFLVIRMMSVGSAERKNCNVALFGDAVHVAGATVRDPTTFRQSLRFVSSVNQRSTAFDS